MKQETNITKCTLEEVFDMEEGLVIQGCGGDLGEWVDGITSLLVESKVVDHDFRFFEVLSFQCRETINLVFPIEEKGLNMGKLAQWRLENREHYGAVWLSDYKRNSYEHDVEGIDDENFYR